MRFRDDIWPGTGRRSITISYPHEGGWRWANTETDWHLLPVSAPAVTPPLERRLVANVPGRNGTTEFSTCLTGYPIFNAREGSWKFYYEIENGTEWGTNILDKIGYWLAECTQPNKMRIELEDEPGFYYIGRVWADTSFSRSNDHSVITLNYRLYPFKFLCDRVGDYLWDSFNFEYELGLEGLSDIRVGTAPVTLYLPPSDRPAYVRIRAKSVRPDTMLHAAQPLVRCWLRKSLGAKYGEAPQDHCTRVPMMALKDVLVDDAGFVIDADPRYDVYELLLEPIVGEPVDVDVVYDPGYF